MAMNAQQLKMARHALGLPNQRRRSYRNWYYAPRGTMAALQWFALVLDGLAYGGWPEEPGIPLFFGLTEAGACEAIEGRETLDREDFPHHKARKATR